jgi:hypothetical protein
VWKGWCWVVRGSRIDGPRGWRRAIVLSLLTLVLYASAASASERFDYQSPIESALGLHGAFAAAVLAPQRGGLALRVEAGERSLFGIEGLGIAQARAGVFVRRVGVEIAAAALASPVGSETLARAEPIIVLSGGAVLSCALRGYRVRIDRSLPEDAVLLDAQAFAPLRWGTGVGYVARGYRLAGMDPGGAGLDVFAVAGRRTPVSVIGRVLMARAGDAGYGVSAYLRFGETLAAAFGYDSRTEIIAGAVSLEKHHVVVRVGAELHPVLGVTRSASVGWESGR